MGQIIRVERHILNVHLDALENRVVDFQNEGTPVCGLPGQQNRLRELAVLVDVEFDNFFLEVQHV